MEQLRRLEGMLMKTANVVRNESKEDQGNPTQGGLSLGDSLQKRRLILTDTQTGRLHTACSRTLSSKISHHWLWGTGPI